MRSIFAAARSTHVRRAIPGAGALATVAFGTAALTAAGAGVASAAMPSASGLAMKLVSPSTLASNGSYKLQLSLQNPSSNVCGTGLSRAIQNDPNGHPGTYEIVARFPGTKFTDLASTSWGLTTYRANPRDCNGNFGAPVFTPTFTPTVVDDPFNLPSGVGVLRTAANAYGGAQLQVTSGVNSHARWSTDDVFNLGVVIGTGPHGGIANLFVDGVKKGQINFYSAKAVYRKVTYSYNTPSDHVHQIDVVTAKQGTGGGTEMYLDAGIENAFP